MGKKSKRPNRRNRKKNKEYLTREERADLIQQQKNKLLAAGFGPSRFDELKGFWERMDQFVENADSEDLSVKSENLIERFTIEGTGRILEAGFLSAKNSQGGWLLALKLE